MKWNTNKCERKIVFLETDDGEILVSSVIAFPAATYEDKPMNKFVQSVKEAAEELNNKERNSTKWTSTHTLESK